MTRAVYCILAFTSLHRRMPVSPSRLLLDIESVASHSVGCTHVMCSRGRGAPSRASPQIMLQWPFSPMAPLGLMWRCLWGAPPWVKWLGHRVCGYIIQQSSVRLPQHGCTHRHPPTQDTKCISPTSLPHLALSTCLIFCQSNRWKWYLAAWICIWFHMSLSVHLSGWLSCRVYFPMNLRLISFAYFSIEAAVFCSCWFAGVACVF